MKLYGNHWLVHFLECRKLTKAGRIVIDDAPVLEKIIVNALERENAHILFSNSYQFKPQGVTVVVGISESHASAHTWPEDKFVEFDFNTCNPGMSGEKIIREIGEKIGAKRAVFRKVERFMGEIEFNEMEVIEFK